MDLRQLSTFRTVCELGSLSKASERLHVAQPALGRQIKLLEHSLRTQLFVRHGRGMVPTDAGRLLFDRTSGVVRRLEQARDEVAASAGAPSGRVVIGMVPTICSSLATKIATHVASNYPMIELRIVEAYGSYLIDWLHRSEIDLAITYGPVATLHLAMESLGQDELVVVGAPGQGLAERNSMTLNDLDGEEFILPSAPHSLRVLVDKACAKKEVSLKVKMEADAFLPLLDIVTAGIGKSFLPYYSVSHLVESGKLESAALHPILQREIVLAQPRLDWSLANRTVSDIIRREVRKLLHSRESIQ